MGRHRPPTRRMPIAGIVGVICLVIGIVLWIVSNQTPAPQAYAPPPVEISTDTSTSPTTQLPTEIAPSPIASTRPTTVPTQMPAVTPTKKQLPTSVTTTRQPSCASQSGSFVPTRLVLERLNIDLPVLAMPLAGDGTFPVPPMDQRGLNPRQSASWWKDGAAPGSRQGVAHFDVHTYLTMTAAGNFLGTKARTGDTIKVLDGAGKVGACYRVDQISAWDLNHVPDSLGRTTGPSGLVIEFCWDRPENWGHWLQRKYVIATPIA